jgi:hypothetical protein
MYALYEKVADGQAYRYRFAEHVSLFGCNSGYIPRLLAKTIDKTASEPLPWHFNVDDALRAVGQKDHALIINLKPNSKEANLSLYEIMEVFGHSSSGWTPVMLYLRGLFVDDDPSKFDTRAFVRAPADAEDPIFSMTYLSGSIRKGALEGRWTVPGPSSTNSVLLWPDAFKYFAEQAQTIMERIV